MSRIAAIWKAWVRLLDRREPGDTIALFRIAVAVVILSSLGEAIAYDLVDAVWVDRQWGGYRSLGNGPYLIALLGGPRPDVVWSVLIATVVLAVLLGVGLGGRVTSFLCLQGYIALHRLNHNSSGSSDILVTNALWLLTLARSTATLSLDCRIRTGKFRSDEAISAFPRYLAIAQLVTVYTTTGLQKVSVYWFPAGYYSALYYILQQPAWQRFDMAWAAKFYPVTQLATAVTWLWEVTAPLLLLVFYYRYTADRGGRMRRWMNRFDLRKPWVLTGIMLHLGILIAMDVGHFSTITMCFYLCLWQPEELREGARWVRAKLGLRDAVRATSTTREEKQMESTAPDEAHAETATRDDEQNGTDRPEPGQQVEGTAIPSR
ncbi:hypothetical protein [Chondromyces crocatus]|uniref:HTTM domain-containing protein n=1 Tax=Chondromyces crocatus TaxID=52 RepID=A0A0K1EJ91_CHOCO|nr:hypothetical protein [Chondromyces crocatus]AKT40934.1 uncharacterized protein CMC5_050910 [Chondromyces crocatus]